MATESKSSFDSSVVKACGVSDALDGTFVERNVDLGEVGEYDIVVKIISCGSCHTDHFCLGTKGAVPGHEAVGRVVAKGENVAFELGARVGLGWQLSSCGTCENCVIGLVQCCDDCKSFMRAPAGGYSSHVKWDARFAVPIPDGLSSQDASPLLCAGVTMYNGVAKHCTPGQRVGIIGIGGLGHVGLQFARAWGCHVTALSRSEDKKEMALKFGAHEFINTKTDGELEGAERFNVLISTVAADLDWTRLMGRLKAKGKLVIIGVPKSPVAVPASALIMKQRQICGSLIGNPHEITKSLEFAQLHSIKPQIELVPLTPEGATEAVKKVSDNTARYRMVLVAADEDATATA